MRERNRQREGEIFGVPKALFCLVGVFVGSFSLGIPMERCSWGFYPWVSKHCSPPQDVHVYPSCNFQTSDPVAARKHPCVCGISVHAPILKVLAGDGWGSSLHQRWPRCM